MWKGISNLFSRIKNKNKPTIHTVSKEEWNTVWGENGLMQKLRQSKRQVGNVSKQTVEVNSGYINEQKATHSPNSSTYSTNSNNLILLVGENYSMELEEKSNSLDLNDREPVSIQSSGDENNFNNEVALVDTEYKIVANIWNVERDGFSRNYLKAPLYLITDTFISSAEHKATSEESQDFTKYLLTTSKGVCRLFASKTLNDNQYEHILHHWKHDINHTKHSPIAIKHPKNYNIESPIVYFRENAQTSNNYPNNILFDQLFRNSTDPNRLTFFGGTGCLLTPDTIMCCRHGTMTSDSSLNFELHHCVYSFDPTGTNIFSLKNDPRSELIGTLMPVLGFNDFQIIDKLLATNIDIDKAYVNDYSDLNLYRLNKCKSENINIYLPVIHKYRDDNQILTFGYDGPVNTKTIESELRKVHGAKDGVNVVTYNDLNIAFLDFKGLNISLGYEKQSIAVGDPYRINADYSSWNGHSGGPVISQDRLVNFYRYNKNKPEPLEKKGITFTPFIGIHTGRVFELENSKVHAKHIDLEAKSPDDENRPKPLNTALQTESDCFIILYHKYVWPILHNYIVNDWKISINQLPEDFQEWFKITSSRYEVLTNTVNQIIGEQISIFESSFGNNNFVHMSKSVERVLLTEPQTINSLNIENTDNNIQPKKKLFCCF